MGSARQPFARNVEFEATFPELGRDQLAQNRHGDRSPAQARPAGDQPPALHPRPVRMPTLQRGPRPARRAADADCDYQKAPFFNVLAAFWIQFMTHDWFSHLQEGRNDAADMAVGCAARAGRRCRAAAHAGASRQLGCRPATDRPA